MDKEMQRVIVKVANKNGFDPASLLAVVEIESLGRSFEQDGTTPCLLFERHIFFKQLKKLAPEKLEEAKAQGLVREKWDRATQYKDQGTSKGRLAVIEAARAIDEEAANCSASWGVGQTMGFNAKECGFASATEMVGSMASIQVQIEAMVSEINKHSAKQLRAKDWTGFARIYNGPGYAQNRYDTRLEAAYEKWKKALDPNDPETGEERTIIPPSRVSEPEPMTKSGIGNGSLITGGAIGTGTGAIVAEKVIDKASDKASEVAGNVIDGASHAVFTLPTIVLLVCAAVAIGACAYIWIKRRQMKQNEGV